MIQEAAWLIHDPRPQRCATVKIFMISQCAKLLPTAIIRHELSQSVYPQTPCFPC